LRFGFEVSEKVLGKENVECSFLGAVEKVVL
jgi:hypothetical protein